MADKKNELTPVNDPNDLSDPDATKTAVVLSDGEIEMVDTTFYPLPESKQTGGSGTFADVEPQVIKTVDLKGKAFRVISFEETHTDLGDAIAVLVDLIPGGPEMVWITSGAVIQGQIEKADSASMLPMITAILDVPGKDYSRLA